MFDYTPKGEDEHGRATTLVKFTCDTCRTVVEVEAKSNVPKSMGNVGVMRAREAMMVGQEMQSQHRKVCKGS